MPQLFEEVERNRFASAPEGLDEEAFQVCRPPSEEKLLLPSEERQRRGEALLRDDEASVCV